MVFKRRDKRKTLRIISETIYPPGGWGRAVNYVYHRLRRLPDPPHRIARGIAAGIFVTCTPLFGFHIFAAAFLAWLIRGNIIASLLGTLFGNPITFPFIAAGCYSTGVWLLDRDDQQHLHGLPHRFAEASKELWHNIQSAFGPKIAHWDTLAAFYDTVFLPYLLGGTLIGLLAAFASYMAAHPIIDTYQRRRARLLQQRLQARLKADSRILAE
ncbi:MAG: DUF2062 domain-containing protein [Mangrovicoccus sp.]